MGLSAYTVQLIRAHETKVRFGIAGGLNTLFGLSIYPILYFLLNPLGVHYLIVLVICQVTSVLFAYMTNKLIVFKTKGDLIREFAKFSTFYATNFAINLLVLPILVSGLKWSPVWAQSGFVGIVIVTSYFWHSRITFSDKGRHQLDPNTDQKM